MKMTQWLGQACVSGLLSAAIAAHASAREANMTLDQMFLKVAQEQAHFAGLYREQGRLVVLSSKGEPVLNSGMLREMGFGDDAISQAKVQSADYNFTELHQAHEALTQVMTDVEWAHSSDIDERENRIVLYVHSKTDIASANALFKRLETAENSGIYSAKVVRDLSGNASLKSALNTKSGGLQLLFDNTLGSQTRCTWGFTAILDGIKGFVTNSHCSDDTITGTAGGATAYTQAIRGDGAVIAREYKDVEATSDTTIHPACNSRRCRLSDSLFAAFEPNFDAPVGFIARPKAQNNTFEIDPTQPYFRIVDEKPMLLVGDIVHKVGRTTGWTSGEVISTCTNTTQRTGPNDTKTFLPCQHSASFRGDSGDSGSPVFVRHSNGTDVSLVGLYHTGGTDGNGRDVSVFSTLDQVRQDLGDLQFTAPENQAIPSLDVVQIPGLIDDNGFYLKSDNTKTYTLEVPESGRYQVFIQSASDANSRLVDVSLNGKQRRLSLDAKGSVNFYTNQLEAGRYALNITAKTTNVAIRQVQAVAVGQAFYPSPELPRTIFRTFSDGSLPLLSEFFFVSEDEKGEEISQPLLQNTPQSFDVVVDETGSYVLQMDFTLTSSNQLLKINLAGQEVIRAVDIQDEDEEFGGLGFEEIIFHNLPVGKHQLVLEAISSDLSLLAITADFHH